MISSGDGISSTATGHADPTWITSSRCAGNGSCVEVAILASGDVLVRDGKNPVPGAFLSFTPGEWRGFLASVAVGEVGLH